MVRTIKARNIILLSFAFLMGFGEMQPPLEALYYGAPTIVIGQAIKDVSILDTLNGKRTGSRWTLLHISDVLKGNNRKGDTILISNVLLAVGRNASLMVVHDGSGALVPAALIGRADVNSLISMGSYLLFLNKDLSNKKIKKTYRLLNYGSFLIRTDVDNKEVITIPSKRLSSTTINNNKLNKDDKTIKLSTTACKNIFRQLQNIKPETLRYDRY